MSLHPGIFLSRSPSLTSPHRITAARLAGSCLGLRGGGCSPLKPSAHVPAVASASILGGGDQTAQHCTKAASL